MATAIGTYATRALVEGRVEGTFTAGQETVIDSICDGVNMEIETTTGRVLAPVSSATYLFDGNGTRVLRIPNGVRTVSLLEIAPNTGGTFATIASTDYFLRPLSQDRRPAMPATEIWLSDIPAGNYATYPYGLANVRVTMTTGPTATPDDVTRIAVDAAVRAWNARQIGQPDGDTVPVTTNFLSRRDRELLAIYSAHKPGLY